MRGMNLDASDTEFHQCPEHLPPSDFIGCAADGDLDKKTVIVRLVRPASVLVTA